MTATKWRADPSTVLLVLCVLFIIYATLIPFTFTTDINQAWAKLDCLRGTLHRRVSRSDVVSNVLLFMPFGGMLAVRRVRRGTGLGATLLGAALAGMALSVLVETCQLFAPSRVSSLVDVMTNTSGATLGATAGWFFCRLLWPDSSIRVQSLFNERPLVVCALAVAVGLAFAGLSPFDVSIQLSDLRAALGRARPVPFGPSLGGAPAPFKPGSWVQEGLAAVLTGGLFALSLREIGKHGLALVAATAALGGALALAIELAQVTIRSRDVDMTSVLIALVGSAVGAAVVGLRAQRTARAWVGPALAVWMVVVALGAWTPFRLAAPGSRTLHAWQLLPFWVYYERCDMYAVSDLLNQIMSFIPLGVLLAVQGPPPALRRALVAGLVIGFVLEAGQFGLAERTAEITDVLSAGAGAFLGALLWQWAAALRTTSAGHARYRVSSR